MKEKRKPNWSLCVREGERWCTIGAAWDTERGNLYVRLDEGERLEGTAMLFPFKERAPSRYGAPERKSVPSKPSTPQPSEPDYMERQRQARAARPSVSAPPKPYVPPPNADEPCPDPEPPDWL